jgi:PAS domain S-box-containing protein
MEGVHQEDYDACLDTNAEAMTHRRPFEVEYRLRRHDGQDRWIVSRGVPRFDAAGAFAGYIGSAIDITERKVAEREMHNFVSLVGQSADFIGMATLDARLLFLNLAGQRLVGLASEEDARRAALFDFVYPEDEPIAREAVRCALAGEEWSGELRFQHLQTARPIPVCANVFLLRDEGNRPMRLATVTRDLTGQKATEEYLRRQDRLKDEFLATLSHELRTPLNAILGWAHILRSTGDAEMTAKGLQTIVRSSHALNQLVSDLLDVSRIIAGKLVLNVGPTSLVAVVEAALDTVRLTAQAKEVTLATTVDAVPPGFFGDPDRLQQVVGNLLVNAIKFTPVGGRVQVHVRTAGPRVEIVVEDDGPGISPEFLPYIFDRFRQADSSTTRRQGGLGLGLAIVRHLVELHGGEVEAANRVGVPGSAFTVRLPKHGVGAPVPSAVVPHPVEHGAAWRQTAPRLDGIKVLVIDDEPDARDLVSMVLESCGAEIVTADSAAAGLHALMRQRPDVVLADIAMPEGDGYEFLRQVRALSTEEGGLTPAAALTAYASRDDRLNVLRAGFQMHVAKPAQPAELVAVVAHLASAGRLRREAMAPGGEP